MMDVNEDERLSNYTLRNKLEERKPVYGTLFAASFFDTPP
jgi:hypothetical protein